MYTKIKSLLIQQYPIILIILIPLLFFYPILLGFVLFPGEILFNDFYPWRDLQENFSHIPWTTHNFFGSDPVLAHYPWKFLGIETLKSFAWPLWNPYSFAGAPLMANSQSALFYPLNFIYFMIDFATAWSIITLLQVILSGLFMYLLLRSYNLSKVSALWGSMIFSWNGFVAHYFHIQVIGHTILWLPLIILAIKKIHKQKSPPWIFVLIFSLSASFLAGHLQVFIYCLIITFFITIFSFRNAFLTLICSLLVSLGISAIQLLPTIEYLGKVSRTAEGFYDVFLPSYIQLIRFLSPRFFGHPTTGNWWGIEIPPDHAYIGILGFIFAIIGVYFSFKLKNYIYISLALLIILFTNNSFFTNLIYGLQIPFLSSVTPGRGFGMIVFPLAILSSFGFEYALVKSGNYKKILLCIISFTLFILVALYIFSNYHLFQYTPVIKSALAFPLIILLISFTIILSPKNFLSKALIITLLFCLQTVDILRENKFFTRSFTSQEQLYPATELINFLQSSEDRFLSLDLWALIANTFIPYKLSTITDYDAVHLNDSMNLVDLTFSHLPQAYPFDSRSIRFSQFDTKLAGMLNVRYVLNRVPMNDPNLKLVRKIGSVYIYENNKVLPRAYLVPNYQILEKSNEQLLDSKIDFKKVVFLKEYPNFRTNNESSTDAGEVRIVNKGFNEYNLLVNTDKIQWLFLSESFDDGWEAFIDNKKTKIYKANLSFQAIVIPAGEHSVRFIYNPQSFRLGLIISIVSISLLIFSATVLISRRFKRY